MAAAIFMHKKDDLYISDNYSGKGKAAKSCIMHLKPYTFPEYGSDKLNLLQTSGVGLH